MSSGSFCWVCSGSEATFCNEDTLDSRSRITSLSSAPGFLLRTTRSITIIVGVIKDIGKEAFASPAGMSDRKNADELMDCRGLELFL